MDAGQAAARRGRIVTRYAAALILAVLGLQSATDGRYKTALFLAAASAGTAVAARRKRRGHWLREAGDA